MTHITSSRRCQDLAILAILFWTMPHHSTIILARLHLRYPSSPQSSSPIPVSPIRHSTHDGLHTSLNTRFLFRKCHCLDLLTPSCPLQDLGRLLLHHLPPPLSRRVGYRAILIRHRRPRHPNLRRCFPAHRRRIFLLSLPCGAVLQSDGRTRRQMRAEGKAVGMATSSLDCCQAQSS